MSTSVKGLPYPEPADPIRDGAAAIKALALALDFTLIPVLTAASGLTNASFLDPYPVGISLLNLAAGDATAGAWPSAASSHVMTIKTTSSRAAQFCFLNSGTLSRAWYRQLVAAPGPNSPWVGLSAPYGQASGTATLNAATDPTASVQVNFPTGRFNRTPRVVVSSSTPSVHVGVQAISATAVTLIGRNLSAYATTLTAYWMAAQATESSADG